jgi:hypothetical protein
MKRSRRYFHLPEDPKLCALYRLGGRIEAVNLAGAEKSYKSGRAKRLNDRWIDSQHGEVLLPFYDEPRKCSTNLSSRMSPAAKPKGQLTTRNIAGSGYLSMIEAGVFVHTCDKDYARNCAACLFNFWRHQFPIDVELTFCDGKYFYMEGDYRPTRFKMNDKVGKSEKGETLHVFRSRTTVQKRDPRIPENPESVEISR